MWSPTRPLPRPSALDPGARTSTGPSAGRLSIPVVATSLSALGRTLARLTLSTLEPGAETIQEGYRPHLVLRTTPMLFSELGGDESTFGAHGAGGGHDPMRPDDPQGPAVPGQALRDLLLPGGPSGPTEPGDDATGRSLRRAGSIRCRGRPLEAATPMLVGQAGGLSRFRLFHQPGRPRARIGSGRAGGSPPRLAPWLVERAPGHCNDACTGRRVPPWEGDSMKRLGMLAMGGTL